MSEPTVGLTFDPIAAASQCEEDALVQGLRLACEDAYETLILRFQQPVYTLVSRLMCNPGDTCDVVQEVFLKIFRNIGQFRGGSSLKTWIYRIAVNEAYNHRRWFSRHQQPEIAFVPSDEPTGPHEENLTDPGRSPFELTLDQETRVLVENALAKLNPKFRAAVILRDIEDMSYEEIATVLGVSLGTVKSRILRGRESLRKILEGRLEAAPSFSWSPQMVE